MEKKLCIKVFLTMLALILLVSSHLFAGTTGKIAGQVFDQSTDEPLPGANVVVVGTTMGTSTDQDGLYFIINIPPGVYSVNASFMGYEGMTKTEALVLVDQTTSLDFVLKTTVIAGEEIIVVAERPVVEKDVTASKQYITTEDINQSWARTLDEVMELQTGVFKGHIRGGTLSESVYMLDNTSLNSGLLSDNYTGINLSTVQEVSVLTGGYNAEYGAAQSGIVNIVTREGVAGIHGTALIRSRPAGKYHFGRHMFSKEGYDWTNFDLAYWTAQSQDPQGTYFGQDPNALLAQWQKQITPNEIMRDYDERAEYETEVTLYGAVTSKLGFLFSGRYKRGVSIFPQPEKYNPEFNFQGKLNYRLSDAIKITLNGLYGGYTTYELSPSNFNNTEVAQQGGWYGVQQVQDPYDGNKFDLKGAFRQWPEQRRVSNFSLNWSHLLSPKTFYEVNVSYLEDDSDRSDRDGYLPPILEKTHADANVFDMVGHYQIEGYFFRYDKINTKVYSLRGDITSQVTKNHQVKGGFVAKSYDFSFASRMSAEYSGQRWNLMNVFDGTPYEGAAYVQDKIELAGLIINAGLRLDFFAQNRDDVPKFMFDPLAFEETTPGNETPGSPGTPERVSTELEAEIAPRLGISHPISENTVLHFTYGHFYQRPSWSKMFGFAYINYFKDDEGNIEDPYDGDKTYMDQWQGYQGNPLMGYERTIQYEIGVDQNIANLLRLDITGYYKDGSGQTIFREFSPREDLGGSNTWTTLVNALNPYNVPLMISNSAFTDIRGLEIMVDTRFNWPLNFSLSYDLSYSTGGVLGYTNMYEGESGVDTPQGYGQMKKVWNNNHKFKGVANLNFSREYGPILSDVNLNVFFEAWNGLEYTYHPPGDPSTEPNNERWEPHYRTNLRLSKGFQVMGVRPEISIEVVNLFNDKDLIMLSGTNLDTYHETGELPKHGWSGEPNEWGWYNVWDNPPRQVYFQLKVDF